MPRSNNPGITSRKISEAMKEQFRTGRRTNEGCNNPAWRGGRTLSHSAGYVRVKLAKDDPFRPMADSNGYVYEHRLIKARELGRLLTREETVHHDNIAKSENKRECLILFPNKGTHAKHHHPRTRFIRCCTLCGEHKEYLAWQIKANKTGRFFCCSRHAVIYLWDYLVNHFSNAFLCKGNFFIFSFDFAKAYWGTKFLDWLLRKHLWLYGRWCNQCLCCLFYCKETNRCPK